MSVPRPRALKTHLRFLSGSPKRQGVKNRGRATEDDQGQEVTVDLEGFLMGDEAGMERGLQVKHTFLVSSGPWPEASVYPLYSAV